MNNLEQYFFCVPETQHKNYTASVKQGGLRDSTVLGLRV
jgi:hypothetical protein